MPRKISTAEFEAFLADERFHRTFELPADPSRARPEALTVQYADYGYRNEADPSEENVILFFGPMMGSRLIQVAKDELAKRHKVRIINPDRPSIGGTSTVDIKSRMKVWHDVIPALLRHLNLQHVSLASHSGGTIYALDVLLHHPEILHPDKPYLAMGAPWILTSHCKAPIMALTSALPNGLISLTDKLASFYNNNVAPVITPAFDFSQVLTTAGKPRPAEIDTEAEFEEALTPHLFHRIYKQDVRGLTDEALVLLQKVPGMPGWDTWSDYDDLIPKLSAALGAAGRHLELDVFFAEKDHMVGPADSPGPKWLDSCFVDPGPFIRYSSATVKDAAHETIWSLHLGVAQSVFQKVGVLPPVEDSAAQEHVVPDT